MESALMADLKGIGANLSKSHHSAGTCDGQLAPSFDEVMQAAAPILAAIEEVSPFRLLYPLRRVWACRQSSAAESRWRGRYMVLGVSGMSRAPGC